MPPNEDITQEHHGAIRNEKPRYRLDRQSGEWVRLDRNQARVDEMAERLVAESEVYVPGHKPPRKEPPREDAPFFARYDLEDLLRRATMAILFVLVVLGLALG